MVLTKIKGTIRSSTFLRHNFIFFAGSVAIGALNYLYYPVIGRMLQPAAFGETQTLVSLFLQISIFLTVLGMLTINIVANYTADGAAQQKQRDRVILELEKFALLISLGLLILTVLFGGALERFFQFSDYLPFVLLGLAVVVTVPFTFRSAYLRGQQFFGITSLAGIVGAGAKLAFSAIFVAMGMGTAGAILGVVLAQFLAFLYAALYARRHGFRESLFKQMGRLPDLRLILPELKYALLVLVCSLTITGLYSIDIVVVKHYFDARTAGLYAGIAAVARIVFFLTASITQVLMSAVRLQNFAQQNSAVVTKSFVLLSVIGGGTVALFWAMPRLIVGHLMGADYLAYASLLPRLSLVVFLISILNLFITYHMALRRYSIALIVIMGGLASVLFLAISHGTLMNVVNGLLYGSIVTLTALGLWLGVAKLKQAREVKAYGTTASIDHRAYVQRSTESETAVPGD
jgi:O-antigen/teichoic acid export membrane protein